MEILRLERENRDFYAYMGPIFGSRIIEKETGDRFYDDPEKLWYIAPGRGAASVRAGVLRNFWASDEKTAFSIAQEMLRDNRRLSGVASRRYESVFKALGFTVQSYRKNFIEVYLSEKD